MNHLYTIIDCAVIIPDMPIKDQLNLQLFINNLATNFVLNQWQYEILESNFSKDYYFMKILLKEQDFYKEIKGPNLSNLLACEAFRQKYHQDIIFTKEDYLFCKKTIDLNDFIPQIIIENLIKHPWSINMLWQEDSLIKCCRPIRNIYLKINDKVLEAQIQGILFTDYLDQQLNKQEKQTKIYQLLENYKSYQFDINPILKEHIFLVNDPMIIEIDFDIKYLQIPTEILKYCLAKELWALLLMQNNQIVPKALIIIEKNVHFNKNKFKFAIEAKLLDLLYQYIRDLNKPMAFYINMMSQRMLGPHLGNIEQKNQRVSDIYKSLFDYNSHIEQLIYFSKLDLSTEIIQEFPMLTGYMTAQILRQNKYDSVFINQILDIHTTKNNLISKQIILCDKIDNLLQGHKYNYLPKKDHDPFGFKSDMDIIVQYFVDKIFIKIDILLDIEKFFLQRLYLAIEKLNPHLVFIHPHKIIPIIQYTNLLKDFSIPDSFVVLLIRIDHLGKKSKTPLEDIKLDQLELNLKHNIESIQLNNWQSNGLNNILNIATQVTNYLDQYKIHPYRQRFQILTDFFNKLNEFLDIAMIINSKHK